MGGQQDRRLNLVESKRRSPEGDRRFSFASGDLPARDYAP
jgi:hypothetical protein